MNETMPMILLPGGRAETTRRRTFHGMQSLHTKIRQGGRRRVHGSVGSIPQRPRREDTIDWKEGVDDYNLPWLFDPNRNDHLPLEQQLKMYAKRDLHKGKLFNIGARLWPNEERCRKRVINVTGGVYSYSASVSKGVREGFHAPPLMQTTGQLRPHKPRVIESDPKEVQEKLEQTKMEEHRNWVEERKKFRKQLDGLGLSEEYLRRKPDKTLMESRVLREMVAERTAQPPPLPPEEEPPLLAILPSESPLIRRPSPIAIRIIEKFLRQKKLRLVDLFTVVDKDKNWLITREDFRKAIQQAKIPISEVLLEDLVLTLDTDLDDVLDYRDLAQGMGLWKTEKWETKRKQIAHAAAAEDQGKQFLLSGLEKPDTQEYDSQEGSLPTDRERPDLHQPPQTTKGRTSRIKSALSALSSRSSPFLEPPEPDLRPEQMILSSEEAMVDLRKRDREALPRNLDAKKKQMKLRKQCTRAGRVGKPQPPKQQPSSNEPDVCTIIKTGDTAVDNHFARSTLGGSACMKLNKFRQAVFNEYVELCRMCERAEIPLTEEILRRALLYPPDKPYSKIKKHIRQPQSLISRESFSASNSSRRHSSVSGPGGSTSKRGYPYHPNYSVPAAGPGMRRSKRESGDYDASSRANQRDTAGLYPPAECVIKAPQKMHLSTGKAYVATKVQCWMTFEEYEGMIGKLLNGYTPLPGRCKEGAFWPGYMLDKLRLHMPNEKRDTEGAVFHRTTRAGRRQNYGYDNDLKMWPFEAGGCIQYGEIKPYYQ